MKPRELGTCALKGDGIIPLLGCGLLGEWFNLSGPPFLHCKRIQHCTIVPVGSDSKRICLQCKRPRFNVGKITWSRKWQPTPAFLAGAFPGQRNLADYSSRSGKESGKTELHFKSVVPVLISWLFSLYLGQLRDEHQGKLPAWLMGIIYIIFAAFLEIENCLSSL